MMDIFNLQAVEHYKKSADDYRKLYEDADKRCKDLSAEVDRLKSEIRYLQPKKKNVEEMKESAKKKGCKRGQYCNACLYGVFVDGDKTWCECTYGECDHFVRRDMVQEDMEHEPFN